MDTLFAALRRAVPKKAPREARRNAWILAETWRLVDERVDTRRDPRSCQAERRTLGRRIRRSLSEDRKRRTEEAGEAVEELVLDRLHHGDGQTSVPECRGPGPPA